MWVCRPGTFSSIALQIQPVLGSVIAINCMASISFGKEEESKRAGQSRISLAIMADCFHSQQNVLPLPSKVLGCVGGNLGLLGLSFRVLCLI